MQIPREGHKRIGPRRSKKTLRDMFVEDFIKYLYLSIYIYTCKDMSISKFIYRDIHKYSESLFYYHVLSIMVCSAKHLPYFLGVYWYHQSSLFTTIQSSLYSWNKLNVNTTICWLRIVCQVLGHSNSKITYPRKNACKASSNACIISNDSTNFMYGCV